MQGSKIATGKYDHTHSWHALSKSISTVQAKII